MAIRPNTLENRERELELVDRAEPRERVEPAPPAAADDDADELAKLKRKIREMKLADGRPPDKETHCRACFIRGVDATLKALENG